MNSCTECNSEVHRSSFRDKASWKEFALFGLCQKCQDDVDQAIDNFGVPDDPFASALDWDDKHYAQIIADASHVLLERQG